MSESLYQKLISYGATDAYPLHMPGHKRNRERYAMEDPWGWDITEIDGFDDLHEPEGILKESMELAAALYGADESRYLINGSTAGILAGITACTEPGDRILMARNCHKSVYHAVQIDRLEPVYLHPSVDEGTGIQAGIEPVEVETELSLAEAKGRPISLVVLTSPTYEGILSDVQMIAEICHSHGIPLMVDEAHGAHLSAGKLYTSCFPAGALECGADLVVQSLHKTLASFTQTAILHRKGDRVSSARVKHALDIFQTSSPSYVLMAGIDRCIRHLSSPEGREAMGLWAERLRNFYRRTEDLTCLSLVTLDTGERFFGWDPSKLVVFTGKSGHTGKELMTILREEFHLELEMAARDHVIAMTGIGDTEEGLTRFAEALRIVDERWQREDETDGKDERKPVTGAGNFGRFRGMREVIRILPWKAYRMEGERTPLGRESLGKISLEFVYAYPPGIPILAPGEEITPEVLSLVEAYEKAGIPMRGYEDQAGHRIRTV